MPRFRILSRIDAYVDYVAEVEADNAEEAVDLAYERLVEIAWEKEGVVEFDATGAQLGTVALTSGIATLVASNKDTVVAAANDGSAVVIAAGDAAPRRLPAGSLSGAMAAGGGVTAAGAEGAAGGAGRAVAVCKAFVSGLSDVAASLALAISDPPEKTSFSAPSIFRPPGLAGLTRTGVLSAVTTGTPSL